MLVILALICLLLTACTPALSKSVNNQIESGNLAVGSCSLALPHDASDEEAIWALIGAESRYVVSQEIDELMRLWALDARISDAKHTPLEAEDDQSWRGADVIRHRYLRLVFPSAPSSAQSSEMDVRINGQRAVVTATTQIGEELSLAGDRWEVVKKDGCWLLQNLTFNLEAP